MSLSKELNKKEIFKRQTIIFNFYDDIKNFSLSDGKNLVNNLDKYILHSIEEIIEYFNTTFTDVEEFIDIVNYISTLGAIIYLLGKKYNVELENESNIKLDKSIKTKMLIHVLSLTSIESLIEIRRKIPHRKWHKNNENKILGKDFINDAWYEVQRSLHSILLIGDMLGYETTSVKILSEKKYKKIIAQSKKEGITNKKNV